jgi:hypothetical protein
MAVPFLSGNPFFCSAAPKLFFINILQKKKIIYICAIASRVTR